MIFSSFTSAYSTYSDQYSSSLSVFTASDDYYSSSSSWCGCFCLVGGRCTRWWSSHGRAYRRFLPSCTGSDFMIAWCKRCIIIKGKLINQTNIPSIFFNFQNQQPFLIFNTVYFGSQLFGDVTLLYAYQFISSSFNRSTWLRTSLSWLSLPSSDYTGDWSMKYLWLTGDFLSYSGDFYR